MPAMHGQRIAVAKGSDYQISEQFALNALEDAKIAVSVCINSADWNIELVNILPIFTNRQASQRIECLVRALFGTEIIMLFVSALYIC